MWKRINDDHNNTRMTFIVISSTSNPYARVYSGHLSEIVCCKKLISKLTDYSYECKVVERIVIDS